MKTQATLYISLDKTTQVVKIDLADQRGMAQLDSWLKTCIICQYPIQISYNDEIA